MRWFPDRHCSFVGDAGYGTSATARCCRRHRRPLTLVTTGPRSRLLQHRDPHSHVGLMVRKHRWWVPDRIGDWQRVLVTSGDKDPGGLDSVGEVKDARNSGLLYDVWG